MSSNDFPTDFDNLRAERPFMRLSDGCVFYPTDIPATTLTLDAIAKSLSEIPRYNGHATLANYSVAEHSYHVGCLVPQEYALAALLHDGHESLTGDIPAPLKGSFGPAFAEFERETEAWFRSLFPVPTDHYAAIKKADAYCCLLEMAAFGWIDDSDMFREDVLHGWGITADRAMAVWQKLHNRPKNPKARIIGEFWRSTVLEYLADFGFAPSFFVSGHLAQIQDTA